MHPDNGAVQQRPLASTTFVQGDIEFDVQGFEGDHILGTIAASGDFYERMFLDALAKFVAPGDVVVDAGANIGNHTLYFARMCEAKVVAYEAFAPTVEVLERNVTVNLAKDSVTIRPVALGAAAGFAEVVDLDWTNVGSTTFRAAESGVEVVRLDDADLPGRVVLLKVDVEGMDADVLRGATELIDRDRPVITCEAGTVEHERLLDSVAADLGYTYLARYNATSTFILLPARSDLERVVVQRHLATMTSSAHLGVRDLYYRVRLLREAAEADKDSRA
ncbi:FkbM family methyltransferase [Phycicoccus sp. Root101]|uniref:FkbM family methyltransferase n=1 Tax=Phycicoccus sp. Root101 TaxID=1736421 RepID=UPI000B30FF40|nr:FkbM family methyltransferase [Phycicoccus sp. Root101]